MSKKPPNLLYGVDDKPPVFINFVMGLQHFMIITISFVLPIIIVRESGGTTEQTVALISMSMIAGGIGTIIQSLNGKHLGSGFLCPSMCGPSYLTASLLAVKTGGLSLLFGMLLVAGFAEFLLSRVIHKLRVLFPPEVTGLIVAMVGITMIKLAITYFMGMDANDDTAESNEIITGALTLFLIIGLNIWSRGKIKLFCVLIGMFLGYGIAYLFGLMETADHSYFKDIPIFGFQLLKHPGWSFSWYLVIPFIIAMLSSTLKSIGDLTTCQKINNTNWRRTDMRNVKKGIFADSLSCIAAGLTGGLGQSTSSTNIGLSIATATTSRRIGITLGIILIVLSFFPPIGSFFAIMPKPVLGATMIFAISFMIAAGIQIITSRMLDARKTFLLGISLILGIGVDLIPETFQNVHPVILPVFSSSLATATITAIILNLIFRIGIARKVTLEVRDSKQVFDKIEHFLDKHGAVWGARKEVVKQVNQILFAIAESLFHNDIALKDKDVSVQVSYNELYIDVMVYYEGKEFVIPDKRPDPEMILEDPDIIVQMSNYLVKELAGKLEVKTRNNIHYISFRREH